MKIIVDYQIFYLQHYGGISRYFYELTQHLNQLEECQAEIIAPYHNNKYLSDKSQPINAYKFNKFLKKLLYNRFIDKRIFLSEYLAKKALQDKNTILHETYYSHRFQVNAPKVITIHDMIYELFSSNSKEEKELIEQKKQAILAANAIIVVSQSTKQDLIKFYPQVIDKVYVVYHGMKSLNSNAVKAFANSKPYILFVGNRNWYKNFMTLLEVYADSSELNENFDILCFGSHDFDADESRFIQTHKLTNKIKLISGDDELLFQLYKGASVLAYLSKYEGFGFPVLEAFSMNCRVICSNGSSLPEVAGSFATMINVSDKKEVSKALHDVLLNQKITDTWKKDVQIWLKNFTWSNCARNTLKVYQSVLSK